MLYDGNFRKLSDVFGRGAGGGGLGKNKNLNTYIIQRPRQSLDKRVGGGGDVISPEVII